MARKFFSCCLVGLVIPILLFTLLIFGLKDSIFNAKFYQKSFTKMDLYNQLLDKALPAFMNSSAEGGQNNIGPMDQNQLIAVIKKSIPQKWVDEQIKIISNAFFASIKGRVNSINAVIDLREPKAAFLENISGMSSSGQAINPEEAKQFVGSVPDQYDLGAALNNNPVVASARQAYQVVSLISWISLAITLLFLIIIGLMNLFYPPGMMKWLAIPMMISSAILLLMVTIGQVVMFYFLGQIVNGFDQNFRPIAQDVVKFLINPILTKIQWEAGIILVLSIATLVAAIILSHKFPPKIEPAPEKKIENKEKNGTKTT